MLGFVAVLLAFGDLYGLYRPAYDLLPGLTLFRIPGRFVGLAGFALAILAAFGAETLLLVWATIGHSRTSVPAGAASAGRARGITRPPWNGPPQRQRNGHPRLL